MTDRDPRWEKVSGHILPLEKLLVPYDQREANLIKDIVEFRIEVPWGETVWYTVQRVHKNDLEGATFNIKRFFLDEMVRQIDKYMEGAS